MRKNRVIGQNRCYHLVNRLAHRAFFLDDEEKDRAVALMRRVEAGVQVSLSYCINRAVSMSSDPFAPSRIDEDTVVVRNRLSVFDLPDGVELRMTGNSGICFEDGSGKLILTSNDFDDAGDCIYHFLVPAGVSNPCQFLQAYFNGKEFAQ